MIQSVTLKKCDKIQTISFMICCTPNKLKHNTTYKKKKKHNLGEDPLSSKFVSSQYLKYQQSYAHSDFQWCIEAHSIACTASVGPDFDGPIPTRKHPKFWFRFNLSVYIFV